MNSKLKSFKPATLLGFFIAGILLFSSCSPGKYNSKTYKLKNWVNWEVTFKPNISQADKVEALLSIQRYLLDDINRQGYFIRSFRSTNNLKDLNMGAIIIAVNKVDLVSTIATSTVKPSPPPPKMENIPHLHGVQDIRDMGLGNAGPLNR